MKRKSTVVLLSATMLLSVATADAGSTSQARDHTHQGIAFANMNDYNSAIQEFKASIAVRPTARAYSNLGASYLQVGKPNMALRALKQAEKFNSKDNIIMYNIAATYSLSDDTDLALEYLDKALKQGFNNYDAIRFDPDLSNVRGEPEFRSVLEKNKVFIQ